MAKKPVAGLLRIAWDPVGRIVARVVADHLDESRLAGLVTIGCDEISYRRGPVARAVAAVPPRPCERASAAAHNLR